METAGSKHHIDNSYQLLKTIGSIGIVHSNRPDEALLCLLESTVYGSDGPLYRHLNVRSKINRIQNPHYFTARRENECVGSVCVSERSSSWKGKPVKTFYIRYLSVKQDREFKGLGRYLLDAAMEYFSNTISEPYLTYALIEAEHKLSLNLSLKYGNTKAASYEVLSFSRFRPRETGKVRRISSEEKKTILPLLEDLYKNHALVNFHNTQTNGNYFVLEIEGQIVAGVQVNTAKWKIEELPGLSGRFIMNIVPYIPYLKRLFNPKNFQFCTFEGIYLRPGYKQYIPILFESVLASERTYSALLFGDPSCPVFRSVKLAGKLGFLSKVQKPISSDIMLFASDELQNIMSVKCPFYLSAVDQT